MSTENIYNKLMCAIGNIYGVCGFMGNVQAESNFNSINVQNSYEKRLGMNDKTYTQSVDNGSYKKFAADKVGYGLCQWTSSGRKKALLDFAKQKGTSIGDEDMQIEFAIYELTHSYKNVLKVLQNAKTVKEASDYVCTKYERPADQRLKALEKRASYGIKIFEQFSKEKGGNGMKTYKKGQAVQLSKNFKSTEFDCNGKGCCTETPIEEKLVDVLQKVRDHFGVSVNLNCGYRCPVHNSKTKGASSTSQHLKGNAADIVVKNVHPMRVARFIETIPGFAGRIGCYTWDDSGKGFVHVDVRGTNSRAIYTENNVNYDSVPNFHPTIKRGVTGREVKVVQRRLKKLGYYKKAIDMSCGSGMEQAIIKFNAAHGRQNDKSWGPKCWNEAFPIEK